MIRRRARTFAVVTVTLLAIATGIVIYQLPAIGAGALLHPWRRSVRTAAPENCTDERFQGAGVSLRGWRCRALGERRGGIVYLHGIADNRASAAGVIQRFSARGFDVIAYDSRAHGDSEGNACTYGFFEKEDLRLVLDTVEPGPIVLVGTSLGAAVALQQAGRDPRVNAVVAAETFADLRTVAIERAPFVFTRTAIDRAFALVEEQAGFRVDEVSPAGAAASIQAPVLLIHGANDHDTPSAHSQRVFDALPGRKRLLLVPEAGHNASVRGDVWDEIEKWIEDALKAAGITISSSRFLKESIDPSGLRTRAAACSSERWTRSGQRVWRFC